MPLDRVTDWREFSRQVEKHIEQYTIPQYQSEDGESDQVETWTAEACREAMQRYLNRFGSRNARGAREVLRDMLKIAHYAQFAYGKLKGLLEEGDVYE